MKSKLLIIPLIISIILAGGCMKQKAQTGLVVGLLDDNKNEVRTLFTDKDIESYNWDEQQIVFKSDFYDTSNLGENEFEGGSAILNTTPDDMFAVYLGGRLLYEGTFEQNALSSYFPLVPIIHDNYDGTVTILSTLEPELIKDAELYGFLKEKNLLSEN